MRRCKREGIAYSKVTKKGQITIPSHFREQRFGEGVVVVFKETKDDIMIEPVPDMTQSAGKLRRFATAFALSWTRST